MIIYNVTINVDKEVTIEWLEWMRNEHIPELLDIGLFTDCKLCHLLDADEDAGITYVAQYFCDGIEQYHRYIKEHSDVMRKKGLERFGNKFTAFRTVMEVI